MIPFKEHRFCFVPELINHTKSQHLALGFSISIYKPAFSNRCRPADGLQPVSLASAPTFIVQHSKRCSFTLLTRRGRLAYKSRSLAGVGHSNTTCLRGV